MATYTEVKTDYLALYSQIKALIDSINQEVNLGDGYTMVIKVETKDPPRLDYRLEGPNTDVNRIPDLVLHRYYTNAKNIEDWKAGNLPDFPTLLHA